MTKLFTSHLLRQAWTLAKQAATAEVSSRRLFGWALKEILMTEKPAIRPVEYKLIEQQPRGGRGYIARINGLDGKFGFDRDFLPVLNRDYSRNQRHPWMTWSVPLVEGTVYEIAGDGRDFYVVEGGTLVACTTDYIRRTFEAR